MEGLRELREPENYAGRARALLERMCRQPSVAAQGTGMAAMAALTETLLREAGFQSRCLTAPDPAVPPLIYGEQHPAC